MRFSQVPLVLVFVFTLGVQAASVAAQSNEADLPKPLSPSIRLDDDGDALPFPADAPFAANTPISASAASSANAPSSANVMGTRPPELVKVAPGTATVKPKVTDPFGLQIDFAESAYKLSNTVANLGRVISLYERALASACPGKAGQPGNPGNRGNNKVRCDEIINRLLELDAGNVPALCQRFGLRSPECSELIAAQELGWYDVDAARWRTVIGSDGGNLDASDLESAIETKRNKPQVDQLITARENLVRIPRRETADELKLDQVLQQGLALTCASPKIVFLPRNPAALNREKPNETTGFGVRPFSADKPSSGIPSLLPPDPNPIELDNSTTSFGANFGGLAISTPSQVAAPAAASGSKNPFDSVLSGLNAFPTPKPTAAPVNTVVSRISVPIEQRLRRIRLLGRECYDFVRIAVSLRPEMAQARCALEGWYSPGCKGAFSGGADGGKDGIDSF